MNTTAAVQAIAAQATRKPNAGDMMRAHDAAADFHNAMSEAFFHERDIEYLSANRSPGDAEWTDKELAEARAQYSRYLGEAAAALQKMPAKWAAILGEELSKVGS